MKTLEEARNYENAQNTQSLSSYFKHLGDMNYQILTVDNHGTKHFMENHSVEIHYHNLLFNL